MKNGILLFFGLFFIGHLFAQKHKLVIGTDVPVQYAIGYSFQPVKPLSVVVKTGVLTKPYDVAIVNIIKAFGTDPALMDVVENAFDFGWINQAQINIHARKWHFGLTGQYIKLQAADLPINMVESYYGIDLSTTVPLLGSILQNTQPKLSIMLQSTLLQGGIVVGRSFNFKDKTKLRAEIAVCKNWSNKSVVDIKGLSNTLYGSQHSEQYLSDLISDELHQIYLDYAYTPSINLYYILNLGKK